MLGQGGQGAVYLGSYEETKVVMMMMKTTRLRRGRMERSTRRMKKGEGNDREEQVAGKEMLEGPTPQVLEDLKNEVGMLFLMSGLVATMTFVSRVDDERADDHHNHEHNEILFVMMMRRRRSRSSRRRRRRRRRMLDDVGDAVACLP